LLVIRNGRQEVQARTLTSVCKSGIGLSHTLSGLNKTDPREHISMVHN